ncbi:MAG: cytochrome c [Deltaproteobacteria bacterium]|nr:cytochrome c [Deltaproteobacteria bacterium]
MMLFISLLACGDTAQDTSAGDTAHEHFDAASYFGGSCAGCHNADGSGGIDIGGTPSADLRARVPAMSDDEIATVVTEGKGTMPAQLSTDDEVEHMIEYLRATFP